jgi:hypothetical protein
MKRILDPTFRYRPSFCTDIRKTFAEFRKATQDARALAAQSQGKVALLRAPRSS